MHDVLNGQHLRGVLVADAVGTRPHDHAGRGEAVQQFLVTFAGGLRGGGEALRPASVILAWTCRLPSTRASILSSSPSSARARGPRLPLRC